MTTAALPTGAEKRRVLFASLIGTTIEFFDFYIYATAAVLVFPTLFFPGSDPTTAMLASFATFSIAFFARPVGAVVFGHFGDRIGRKATLVAALMTMGLSTVAIGLLPTYQAAGVIAPLLLATENAPPGKRAWYGMFPQLGAPLGFFLATGSFLLLGAFLDEAAFMSWGWRVPFLGSAVLVLLGLWVRLSISETPAFQRVLDRQERVRLPMRDVLVRHPRALLVGTLSALATFVLFYLMTVFALSWGTSQLGYSREAFLWLQMAGVVAFAVTIPLAALHADRHGRRRSMIIATLAILVFGLVLDRLFVAGSLASVGAFLLLGLGLMGLTYGPIGTLLAEQFPAPVRYTGASLAFNLSGIFGASLAPYIATWLAGRFGLDSVGLYLAAAALLTLAALWSIPRRAPDAAA